MVQFSEGDLLSIMGRSGSRLYRQLVIAAIQDKDLKPNIVLLVRGAITSVTRDKGLFTGGFCGLRRATKRVAKRDP